MHWKGADLITLIKSPIRSHSSMDNRRDISLADEQGKAVGATYRRALAKVASIDVVSSQITSGFGRKGCDTAHLVLRDTLGIAAIETLSVFAIFVDIGPASAAVL